MSLIAIVLAGPSCGFAADVAAGAGSASPQTAVPSQGITLEEGRLTLDVRDAELTHVLKQIAVRAGFRLRTSGRLGRVTASIRRRPIEEALRRLVQDHELMLVYGAVGGSAVERTLSDVVVFAGPMRPDPQRTAAGIAEVGQLQRAGGGQATLARLGDILAGAPDAAVRARAASALGRLGGTTAEAMIVRALGDEASDVRMQALRALLTVARSRAIPALQQMLVRDPVAAVRRTAASLLGSLREAPAESALRAGANDVDITVRQEVFRALARHGVTMP